MQRLCTQRVLLQQTRITLRSAATTASSSLLQRTAAASSSLTSAHLSSSISCTASPSFSHSTHSFSTAASASSSIVTSSTSSDAASPSSPFQREVKRTWHLFDAKDQVVGRLAARIAHLLVGKHKPTYDPSNDDGDFVVILNAKHIKFTGKKWQQKLYRYHTGYVGGLKEIPAERWRESHPDRIIRHAVAGMIHKNKLKVPRLARLKIYHGLIHPHTGQFPFDIIAQVPHLKAARDAEYAELAHQKQVEQDAIVLASGGKQLAKKSAKVDPTIQGEDDGTLPEDPDIRKAIIKDREQRKGKPIVLL